jgi:hypothetical protein
VSKVADAVEAEADEYRQGVDRPLGGYVVLMAIFSVLAGAVGVFAALRGARARRISPYDLILVMAGTQKLARLLAKDAVTSPLRVPFTRYRESGGPAEVMEEVRRDSTIRHAVGELLSCPFCLALWVAGGFTVGLLFAPRFTRTVAAMLTAVSGADFLQLMYAHLQKVAEQ